MPKPHTPRSGSMQFWPRNRTKRLHPKLRRTIEGGKEVKPEYFAGYKVGMTHLSIVDNRKTSITKGMSLSMPVTIIECPPIKILGYRFYEKRLDGRFAIADVTTNKVEKELKRTVDISKKESKTTEPAHFDDVVLLIYTQPKEAGFSKKKPEIFEVPMKGKKEDKLAFAKQKIGNQITINEIFKEGHQIDVRGITRGKGYQGPIRRFGIDRTSHKSEKGVRTVGSLGGWSKQGQVMYRVAYASKHGYYNRVDYNKQILKISDKPQEINPKDGFRHYGLVKTQYILVKGSIPGPSKRLVIMNEGIRQNKKYASEAPKVESISLESKQK